MTQWTESLWGDEGFSAMAIKGSLGDAFGIVVRDTSPPWFYITGWSWGRVFGYSEVALRSMTLLLMLGAAIFAGLLVYKIGKVRVNAVLVGLMTFLSPFLVPFAFEWRMYALLCFSVMGSVYFFMNKKWVGYVLFSLMAIYTHHFGLFTVAGQGIWFLIGEFRWKKLSVKSIFSQLGPFFVLGLLYLPGVYLTYLQTTRLQGSGFWLSLPTLSEVFDLMYRFTVGGVKGEWRLGLFMLVVVLLVVKNWRKVGRQWLGLAVIFLSPVVMAYVVSLLVTPIFYDRYLLSSAMGMMILLGLGTKKNYWPFMLIFVGMFLWQSSNQFFNPRKKNFAEFATYVKEVKREDDALITIQGAEHHLWESKYYGIPAQIYTPNGPLPLFVGTAQMTSQDTTEELPQVKGRIGLITSEPIETIDLPGVELLEYEQFGDLSISWWK